MDRYSLEFLRGNKSTVSYKARGRSEEVNFPSDPPTREQKSRRNRQVLEQKKVFQSASIIADRIVSILIKTIIPPKRAEFAKRQPSGKELGSVPPFRFCDRPFRRRNGEFPANRGGTDGPCSCSLQRDRIIQFTAAIKGAGGHGPVSPGVTLFNISMDNWYKRGARLPGTRVTKTLFRHDYAIKRDRGHLSRRREF